MTPKRILFATMPLDGHFSPLTGLAVHLRELGHDVRWYVGGSYGDRVRKLGLHHYPFVRAQVINQENLDQLFPQRRHIKTAPARTRFDINQLFLLRAPEYVSDIQDIHAEWPFDLIVYDLLCMGALFAQQVLGVKGVAVGVVPLAETDPMVAISGLGKQPAQHLVGRWIQRGLNYVVQHQVFKPCNELYHQLRAQYGLPPRTEFCFDSVYQLADVVLQIGVPGLEYPRQRISPNIRFIGALLPHRSGTQKPFHAINRLKAYKRVVLVTQGTVERDVEKILVPTLEAYRQDQETLVIATTGGTRTAELRSRFPQENLIIEDFIDFNAIMPYVDVYVTNGGYGGAMLALQHQLPMVVAGIHEGKNEIAARLDYARVGIDLRTETPKPEQIRRAVEQILSDKRYRQQVQKLGEEFNQYAPCQLAERYMAKLFAGEPTNRSTQRSAPISA